jgi:uncharacterized protein (TIGR03545 family)
MRKKFVFFALIPAVLVFILLYFFLNSWVESGLEYAGEKSTGAKVEIDDLSLTLSPLGAEFERLQVADPGDTWTNLFQTGHVKFALDFGQLLRGKYIIETMEVNDLVVGAKRTIDGALPKEPERDPAKDASPSLTEQAKDILVPERKNAPMFDVANIRASLNIDSLLNPKNLASYTYIDSLKARITQATAEWQKTVDGFDASRAKLAEIETSVKTINVNNIKDVPSAVNALNTVKTVSAGVNEITNSVKERKIALTQNVNGFTASIKKIDDLVEQDYQHAVTLARLPDLSTAGLAGMLLGKDVLARAYTYLGYVEMVREKVPQMKSEPPIDSPKRLEGQIIHFPAEHSYPKFWIKKILISGGTDKQRDSNYFYATGEILNITNDQRITGFPIIADIKAMKGRGTELLLRASIDRRKPEPLDQYGVKLSGVPVAALSIGQSDFVPAKITGASLSAEIDVRVPGTGFNSETNASLSGFKVQFDRDPKGTVERIVRDVLSAITGFALNLRMWKDAQKFDVAFSTDLDDQISARTKAVLGAELDKIRADIKNRINSTIAAKRQEVERLYAGKKEEVMSKAAAYESQVSEKLSQVEGKKKELEAKVESEKKKATDSVKQKAGDALKKILK